MTGGDVIPDAGTFSASLCDEDPLLLLNVPGCPSKSREHRKNYALLIMSTRDLPNGEDPN
jgi:hypothetical protein